jgi:acyl-CoA hydrolase
MSLGISVDMVKVATDRASMIIAQVNKHMPRVHGDGFIHIKDVNFIIAHDEPLLEIKAIPMTETTQRIGNYVARLVQDGDTIQVGYGGLPNAVMANLFNKKHLGVHTELLSDGLVELIKAGVIDNSRKSLTPGKTVAAFSMGVQDTYTFLNDNPSVLFRTIDFTNNPSTSPGRRTWWRSTAPGDRPHRPGDLGVYRRDLLQRDRRPSRLHAGRPPGAGGADHPGDEIHGHERHHLQDRAFPEGVGGHHPQRGDVRYVVTEYGIAYLHGKNVRERAMSLISIAHPKFRPWLIDEAKKRGIIYKDQAFIPGKRGEYPETWRRTGRPGPACRSSCARSRSATNP